jgi:hypothetical protein
MIVEAQPKLAAKGEKTTIRLVAYGSPARPDLDVA